MELAYNGDNSTATGVEIATYDWDFGDGTTASGVTVTHVFAAGDFVVSLVVTDDAGATSTAELGVAITPAGADTSPGAILFADNCASCHGADGTSPAPDFPSIGGQHPDYLARALMDYKSGARQNPIMSGQVATLSKQDMQDLAAYFGLQKGLYHKR